MQTTLSTNGSSSTQAGADTQKVAANGLSDMFTQLLIAQIKNQDPLSPSDPSQYVSQLATLSQTESMQKLSTLMSSNVSMMQSMQMLALGAQVGASVSVASDHVTLGATPVQGTVTLSNASTATTLVLTGADGVEHQIALGPQAAGDMPISFDSASMGLPAGDYAMRVDTDNGVTASIALTGNIESVRFSSDGAALSIANIGTVMPADIVSFNKPALSR